MRATYEDLLRVARRAAIDVHQETFTKSVRDLIAPGELHAVAS
ncbi:hypothetical protein [Kribbella monticola]|nr:hypothetical protein [Kribbella monticola]